VIQTDLHNVYQQLLYRASSHCQESEIKVLGE